MSNRYNYNSKLLFSIKRVYLCVRKKALSCTAESRILNSFSSTIFKYVAFSKDLSKVEIVDKKEHEKRIGSNGVSRIRVGLFVLVFFVGVMVHIALPTTAFAAVVSGTITSTNLLSTPGSSMTSFDYTLSTLPTGSSVTVQFSTDNTNWYSATHVLNASSAMATIGGASLTLSGFGTPTAFYYKMTLNTDSTGTLTPVVSSVSISSSEAASPFVVNTSGNVGIGTSTPAYPLALASGAHVTVGGVWTNASDINLKENFKALDGQTVLGKIRALGIKQWNYKVENPSITHIGPFAQDFYKQFGLGGSDKSISTIDPSGVALIGIQALARNFDVVKIASSTATSSRNALYIATNGNIGIGTTTPMYKVQVMGDVAASAFVNISTRALKTNITYLTKKKEDSILKQIRDKVRIANYHYTFEKPTDPLRMGLIAEEAPSEVLSVGGKGVDLYKLVSFTLAGVQAQQRQIDSLTKRMGDLEQLVASGGAGNRAASGASGGSFMVNAVTAWLQNMGVVLSESLAKFNNLAAAAFTVGTPEKPNGITLYDEVTGAAYCVKVHNGAMVNEAGVCGSATTTATSTATSTATTTPANAQTMTLFGMSPAHITKGTVYSDLGVSAKDSKGNDLSVTTLVDGVQVTAIDLDTTTDTTYTITYSATDTQGVTATTTREVIVGAGSATATSTVTSTVSTTPTATSTTAMSTATTTSATTATTTATSTDSTITTITTSTPSTTATSTTTTTGSAGTATTATTTTGSTGSGAVGVGTPSTTTSTSPTTTTGTTTVTSTATSTTNTTPTATSTTTSSPITTATI